MKHIRVFTGLITALLAPIIFGGQVFAATASVEQQITVTAVVPSHRDIILDNSGQIIEINSNTTEDVAPDAYTGKATAENEVPVTPELGQQYRQLVPVGTAKRGTLYKRSVVTAIMHPARTTSPGSSLSTFSAYSPTNNGVAHANLSRILIASTTFQRSFLQNS